MKSSLITGDDRPATLRDLREVVATILRAIDQTCVLKDEFAEFKAEVRSIFLTKDEFRQEMSVYNNNIMTMLDKVMGELKTIREEQIVSSYQLKRHTDEIDYLKRVCLPA